MTEIITDIEALHIKFKDGRVAQLHAGDNHIGLTVAPKDVAPEDAMVALKEDIEAMANGYLWQVAMAGTEPEEFYAWLEALAAELRYAYA